MSVVAKHFFRKKIINYAQEISFPDPEEKTFTLYGLEEAPVRNDKISKEEAVKLLTQMNLLRRMENMAAELYKKKEFYGFCHLYAGQEAVGMGILAEMRENDTVTTSYRCHALAYLMSGTILSVLAELDGRDIGVSRGKGGSMHMYGPNFFGGNGIVGSQVPLGNGLSFAHKYRNNGAISFTLYGDGAANQGQIFESFNLAKLWNLPTLFVVENNFYGMGTASGRAAADTCFYKRASFIPGIRLNGMDIFSVRAAVKYAINYIINEKGPIVLEMMTYRYFGHSISDPGTSYSSREEIQNVREKHDPILLFKKNLVKAGIITEEEAKKVADAAKKHIADITKQVAKAKITKIEEMAYDIYKKNLMGKIRVPNMFKPLEHKNLGQARNVN